MEKDQECRSRKRSRCRRHDENATTDFKTLKFGSLNGGRSKDPIHGLSEGRADEGTEVQGTKGSEQSQHPTRAWPSVLRFSASKVSAVCGLHEYADIVQDFLEHVYQDQEDLLLDDCKKLNLVLVSEDDDLRKKIHKTTKETSEKLQEIWSWTKDKSTTTTAQNAKDVAAKVNELLNNAQESKQLSEVEAKEIKKVLHNKINKSVGNRNENLAIESYEKRTGWKVLGNNDTLYVMTFPDIASTTQLDRVSFCDVAAVTRTLSLDPLRRAGEPDVFGKEKDSALFHVCGMIDGVADVVHISDTCNDDWTMERIVIEVKNRMYSFRDPPPLYDQVQTLVYMKLLGCTQADLIQCINDDRAQIQVSRLSLDAAPLKLGNAWKDVLVPRMYQYAAAIKKFRHHHLMRLAFLNGTDQERKEMLIRECPYLAS